MAIERKVFYGIETKVPDGEPLGTVDAFVSASLNEDFGGDIVQPGAFKKFIADVKSGVWPKWPTLLFNHGIELGLAAVTGKVVDMDEMLPGDARLPDRLRSKGLGGLWVRARYNLKTMAGREAYEHRVAGDISDFSYMYEAPDTEIDSKGRRLLKEIGPVFEVSDVLIGMNPETFAVSVKSLLKSLGEEPAPESRRAKLLAEVREILEQVEGHANDPANVEVPVVGRKQHIIDAETGALVETRTVETKDGQVVMVGDEAFHQGALNQAMAAIAALIRQEMAEDSYELDDVRWLAGIGADLRSWAQSENWDAIFDAQAAAADAVTNPPASTTPDQSIIPASGGASSSGQPLGSTGGSIDLAHIPATDDVPGLNAPAAQRILDPFTHSDPAEDAETKELEVTPDEVDEKKIAQFLEIAMRSLLPEIDLSEYIQAPEPAHVIEPSGTVDGLTNWARQRVRP